MPDEGAPGAIGSLLLGVASGVVLAALAFVVDNLLRLDLAAVAELHPRELLFVAAVCAAAGACVASAVWHWRLAKAKRRLTYAQAALDLAREELASHQAIEGAIAASNASEHWASR